MIRLSNSKITTLESQSKSNQRKNCKLTKRLKNSQRHRSDITLYQMYFESIKRFYSISLDDDLFLEAFDESGFFLLGRNEAEDLG